MIRLCPSMLAGDDGFVLGYAAAGLGAVINLLWVDIMLLAVELSWH